MNLLRKLKCWFGRHERFSFEEWERAVGKDLLELRITDPWTLMDWMQEVDKTQDIWIRTCRHCGKRLR